ncbi:MAG: 2-oxoglutarate dehydrogenase E1 component [Planctomycetaceae bacterium]|nr:MAG: 2-oxoglutarate dehydrogenase E1 component [Planctomycetaceae bacterium]
MTPAELASRHRTTAWPVDASAPRHAGEKASDLSDPRRQWDASNLSYVETLYHQYLEHPDNVSAEWQEYFRQLEVASHSAGEQAVQLFKPARVGDAEIVSPRELEAGIWQERLERLIRNYRSMGHYAAQVDPLGRPRPPVPELDPASCGITEADLDRQFPITTPEGPRLRTLREILQSLRNTYCRSIGVQFMQIDDVRVREWLQNRMEATENRVQLTRDEQLRILRRLSDAVVFEDFIQKKFLGKKTFSLEGAETLIPLLDLAIYRAAEQGVEEIVLAMAHRGRLNVLTSIMGKSPRVIFREFADLDPQLHVGRGDVKYHLGYSNDWHSGDGKRVHLSMCFNPSHLEFVNPVAMGRVRAKQDHHGDHDRRKVTLLLIHGDAAFAGEGIVQETLNLSSLAATRIGGTIHVIVNNQIGFTTDPEAGRSTDYATDVAKMLQIPIFHVNGEDPEAVAQVVRLAMDFRQEFQRDVVIDMYCYRLRGHNEQDEPEFTQPLMYRAIKQRKRLVKSYLDHLKKLGDVTDEHLEHFTSQYRQHLESELEIANSAEYVHRWDMLHGLWEGYHGGHEKNVPDVDTSVPVAKLSELLTRLCELPADFHPHPKIHNGNDSRKPPGIYQKRAAMARGEIPLDWGAAESLAFATLALSGHRVRLHGQDVERGTFSHRHAVLHDYENGRRYCPLQHLAPRQAPVEIYNSALSEAGCLGFDYGYSLDCPSGLVCWEAQFGDFANAAQVIIDQFITSAEDKWNRLSGLVMLLPHGFEGQGPEHSSARMERFLTLAAEDNIQVCVPSTPAQYFHLLRRQVLRKWRKPLIVFTPKWLLRHPASTSRLEELAQGTYQRVLDDSMVYDSASIEGLILCSGKIYYELLERRDTLGRRDLALIRLEQLYPFPHEQLQHVLQRYRPQIPVTWVQEEPENMGAWRFLRVMFGQELYGHPFQGVMRPASASPATGSAHSHQLEQEAILSQAIGPLPDAQQEG